MNALMSQMVALAMLALTVFVVFYVATKGINRARNGAY